MGLPPILQAMHLAKNGCTRKYRALGNGFLVASGVVPQPDRFDPHPSLHGLWVQGGVVVKLEAYGTSFVFVSTHLAAHLQHCENRNKNVRFSCCPPLCLCLCLFLRELARDVEIPSYVRYLSSCVVSYAFTFSLPIRAVL